MYRYYDLFAVEKYVEPFSNGYIVYAFKLGFIGDASRGAGCIPDLIRDCSLHYVLPRTSLTPLLVRGVLSVHHVAWAYVAWKFAFHFLSRDTAEVQSITQELVGLGKDSKGIRALVRWHRPESATLAVNTASRRPRSRRACRCTRSQRAPSSTRFSPTRTRCRCCTRTSAPAMSPGAPSPSKTRRRCAPTGRVQAGALMGAPSTDRLVLQAHAVQ